MMKLERRETSKYDACTSANSRKCLRTQWKHWSRAPAHACPTIFFPPGLKDGIITALTDANYTNKNYNNIRWNTLESEEMTKVRTITRKYKSLDVIEFSTQTLALLGQNFHGSDSKVDYRLSIKGRMIRKKNMGGERKIQDRVWERQKGRSLVNPNRIYLVPWWSSRVSLHLKGVRNGQAVLERIKEAG